MRAAAHLWEAGLLVQTSQALQDGFWGRKEETCLGWGCRWNWVVGDYLEEGTPLLGLDQISSSR